MTEAQAAQTLSDLLDGYHPREGMSDEMMRGDGTLREAWQPFIDFLSGRTREDLAQRFARGDQYLRDAGVFFRQYTTTGSTERDWPLSHIPVVIGAGEWARLSEGIVQRAELLERVMADLYGPGKLVSDGLLPPELVARNPEWLRPIVGIQPRSGHFLHFLAFELGRSPDGSWFVLGDRTQAPSGAGFAVETRMATSKVFFDHFPGANVERLAGFFRTFRDAVNGLREDDGRVAILTPGQHTDTYFEHAYIARYLGFMLLEAEDLRVDDGRLSVRTVNGTDPVSVLWRRLDSRFADPLELDETSAIGTPGMVSALRSGAMTMLNCIGSGVLEARALMAFLPRISEALTGEALKMPNIATWWCGQEQELRYVRENLQRMMIGPALSTSLPFEVDGATVLGGTFRGAAQQPVDDWLARDGAKLVGQEAVTLSTTPAMIDGQLVPRPMVVRVFAARTPQGWTVMPGGYARIGRTEDPTALAMQSGGSVADVWVTSDRPVAKDSLAAQAGGPYSRRMPGALPSRAADNLYWLGRYIERAEGLVRQLRAYHLRLYEAGDPEMPLVAHIGSFVSRYGVDLAEPVPAGLLDLFDLARGCAGKIRDMFSTDGWHALDDLAATAREMAAAEPGDDTARVMGLLLRKLAGFSGLVHENMYRSTGWRFLTIGRAQERAGQIAEMLGAFADLEAPAGSFDVAVEVGDSVMTHRRRYAVETNRNTVIDLLALDSENPRSILYQINILQEEGEALPRPDNQPGMSDFARRVLRLRTRLATATPEELTTERLAEVGAEIKLISDALGAMYLE
ncbi:circularly permuted type 2 ATP-grasp protein [Albibacillus kandeliae]|uniref:circularly permuted type 2 ATP-grasp protein n=1 Tax=Albibacillus kandeliae TaxID=2174228 RepID=UPI000D69931B|nr:circularly permuted type 2 ATP-grasp protein [Albibacillus kandeliae]